MRGEETYLGVYTIDIVHDVPAVLLSCTTKTLCFRCLRGVRNNAAARELVLSSNLGKQGMGIRVFELVYCPLASRPCFLITWHWEDKRIERCRRRVHFVRHRRLAAAFVVYEM
jgi:hypothetical protein